MSTVNLRKLTTNSFLYSVTGILQRASSIFLFPIFSSFLSQKDYGILSYSGSLTQLLLVLGFLELPRAMTRLIYKKQAGASHPFRVAGTVLVSCFFNSIIVSSIMGLLISQFFVSQLGEIKFYPYIFLTLLNLPFQLFYTVYTTFLKGTQRGNAAFKLDNLYFLSNISFNLLFVVGFKMDVIGLILSTVVSNMLVGIFSFRVFISRIIKFYSKTILKEALTYSFSLFPFILVGVVGESADNFFLNKFKGASNLGLYYIASTFAAIFALVKESILSSFQPYYFDLHKRELLDGRVSKLIVDIFIVAAFFALGVSYFCFEVLYPLAQNKDLVNAYQYVPLIVCGYFFVFIGQMLVIPVYLDSGLVKYLVSMTIAGVLIGVSLEVFLIPRYGIYGLAVSKLLAFSSHAFIGAYLNKVSKSLALPFLKIYAVAFVLILLSLVGTYDFGNYLLWLGIKLAILGSIGLLLIRHLNNRYGVVKIAKDYLLNLRMKF